MTKPKIEREYNIEINNTQRKELNKIWFLYGNYGKFHTSGNHYFIQRILDSSRYTYEHYKKTITIECKKAVDNILFKRG